ncbi:AraC family transcriptional regulator [Methylobacterium radiotolerans]|nr:AraC family transcriptional regulator [Methylobacterium radiotolerans]
MNGFDVTFRDDQDWVDFGRSYVNSEAFKALFRDGMTLVEETAAYLDGEGRDESRLVSRDATLSYAAESMRLTTLLMQIASWLLVQRAVAEGEMTPAEALQEKHRVKLGTAEPPKQQDFNLLPDASAAADPSGPASAQPYPAPRRADRRGRPTPQPVESPVAAQQGLLRMAFRMSEG